MDNTFLLSFLPHKLEESDYTNILKAVYKSLGDGVCEKIIQRNYPINKEDYQESKYTWKTLAYYANIYEPDNFNQYQERLILSNINYTHNDVARSLFIKFPANFVYTDKKWFECKDGIWYYINVPYNLRRKISEEIFTIYNQLLEKYENDVLNNIKLSPEENLNKTKLAILTEKLKNHTFKNSVVSEAIEFFFVNKINFISVSSSEGNPIPEDYVLNDTDYNYLFPRINMKILHQGNTEEVKKILRKIIEDAKKNNSHQEVKDYLKELLKNIS